MGRLLAAVLIAAVLLAGCVSRAPEGGQQALNLTIRFIDVGQGDAALLSLGNLSILVDGGKSGSEDRIFSELNSTGDGTLELVVATHPDSDHIGGLAGVLSAANFSKEVWDSGTEEDSKSYLAYLAAAGKGKISFPKKGAVFNYSGLVLTVLNPGGTLSEEKNENSIVILATYGKLDLLLTGDCEGSCESALAPPDVEVLKVAHHGSRYATGAAFLAAAKPEISVISVGKNSYGHPSGETIARLEAAGSRVMRTDQLGTIVIVTDGENVWAG